MTMKRVEYGCERTGWGFEVGADMFFDGISLQSNSARLRRSLLVCCGKGIFEVFNVQEKLEAAEPMLVLVLGIRVIVVVFEELHVILHLGSVVFSPKLAMGQSIHVAVHVRVQALGRSQNSAAGLCRVRVPPLLPPAAHNHPESS